MLGLMKRKNMEAKTKETPPVDDEEEMNAFFTLVRNVRDAHHYQMLMTIESQEKVAMKSTWTPSFQWEDFAAADPPKNTTTTAAPSLLPGSSSKNNNGEQESNKTNQHQDLDLNLSL